MTAAVWMDIPPEFLSTSLYTGPGAGPLIAAAAVWHALSALYAAAALELMAMLAAMQAGMWQGPSLESFVAAYAVFIAWLMQASAASAVAAAQQETVATAYTTAVAAMPTPLELTANRVLFGDLVVTNFFGVNIVPLSVTEAKYIEMWIRAATVMAFYELVADTAVPATEPTAPAPQILQLDAPISPAVAADSPPSDVTEESFADTLRNFTGGLVNWDPEEGTVNGLDYDSYADPGDPLWWIARVLEIGQDFQEFKDLLSANPGGAILFLAYVVLLDWPHHILQLITWLAQNPLVWGIALTQVAAGVGAATGLVGLAGMGAQAAALPEAVPVLEPVAAVPAISSAPGTSPALAAPATAPASSPSPPTATGSAASAPLAAGGGGGFPPYLIGDWGPGVGFGSGMSARAKSREPVCDTAAAAAAAQASARDQARARRRRRTAVKEHGHRDEFIRHTMDSGPAAPALDAEASDQGVGRLGFAGTVRKELAVAAAGLTTLVSDELHGGPRMPMVPGTWDGDPEALGG